MTNLQNIIEKIDTDLEMYGAAQFLAKSITEEEKEKLFQKYRLKGYNIRPWKDSQGLACWRIW